MIRVKYKERLGNNLFQYAFGRILAEEMGFQLEAEPLSGFPGTATAVPGARFNEPIHEISDENADLGRILSNREPRQILVHGYFQRFAHYKPFAERIRDEWDLIDRTRVCPGGSDEIWVHVRRTDYIHWNSALPFSYYDEAVSSLGGGKVRIITDDPRDPFLWRFRKFDAQVIHGSEIDDFHRLANAKKLVLSQSSFSWWAAFLSRAESIVFPLPMSGFWHSLVDLRVDEPRYRYLQCKNSYSPNPAELLYQQSVRVSRGLRRRFSSLLAARAHPV